MKNYGEKKIRKNYQKKSINVEKTQKTSEEICWKKIIKYHLRIRKSEKLKWGKSREKNRKRPRKKPEKFGIKTEKEYRQNERSFET